MSATVAPRPLRIGELAALAGTTVRTIRYYEEIGLLAGTERQHGRHRVYAQADVERLREIIRLRDLLGLTLEQLKSLVEAQDARARLRRAFEQAEDPDERRQIISEALDHIATQLELVRERRRELERLERELIAKRELARERLSASTL